MAAYECGCVNVGVGQGDGTFTTVATIDVRPTPEGLVAGDFNRDGTLDLYVLSLTRQETTLLGRGDGTFVMFGDPVIGPRGRDADVADFDRDGYDDVVRVGETLLQIQAPAQPQFVYGANVRADSRGVVAFDVNSDGWADVAVANRGAGGIEVLVNVPGPSACNRVRVPVPTVRDRLRSAGDYVGRREPRRPRRSRRWQPIGQDRDSAPEHDAAGGADSSGVQ